MIDEDKVKIAIPVKLDENYIVAWMTEEGLAVISGFSHHNNLSSCRIVCEAFNGRKKISTKKFLKSLKKFNDAKKTKKNKSKAKSKKGKKNRLSGSKKNKPKRK